MVLVSMQLVVVMILMVLAMEALEVMVRLEEINGRISEKSSERDRFESEANQLATERDKALAEIDSARRSLLADRQEIEREINKELLDLYLKIKKSSGGVAAAKGSDFCAHYHGLTVNSANDQTLAFTITMSASIANFEVVTDTVFLEYLCR